MTARLIMPADVPEMMVLIEQTAREFMPHIEYEATEARWTLRNSIRRGNPTIFVDEHKGEIRGYISAQILAYAFSSSHYVEHRVLYVKPEKRGSRAAVNLIRAFVEWGEIVGAREFYCGTSTQHESERVAKLFEHCGAKRVGFSLKGAY